MRWVALLGLVVLAAVVAAALWPTLGPSRLGGSSSYAIVEGSSMQPVLARGDLAVVHEASAYQVGDVVLYWSALLQRHVLHRIVARVGNRFVLRGDANSFLDPDKPERSDIVGRYWFALPQAGGIAQSLLVPMHAAVAVFLVSLLALLPAGRRRPEKTA